MKSRLLVIGNGMAGSRFCAEMVARGATSRFDITVFGEEPGGAYNRILLSEVLNGSRAAAGIETHSLAWYENHGLKLRSGERICALDRENRTVTSENGEIFSYDVLVLATGSRAALPPLGGLHTPLGERKTGVFVLRTLQDCERVAAYAAKATRAAVIGGGLLGLEAARGLLQHGAQVHLVHRSEVLMNTHLDAEAAALLKRAIEGLGITVHLSRTTTEVLGRESVTGIAFKDGTELRCDMVILAVGATPNIELAHAAHLPVERAILVDDEMRVEDGIYAIGECAQHNGQTYGLVAPVWEQARVLAQILSGQSEDARYRGSKTSTKLKVMGVEVASIGAPHEEEGDEVVCYVEPRRGRYKKLVIRENRLVGAILLGDTRKSAHLTQIFERGLPLPEERAALFFDIGKGAESVLDDEATICNCNAVKAGSIRGAVQAGADSLEKVMSQTRAGTGCGTCKNLVKSLLGTHA